MKVTAENCISCGACCVNAVVTDRDGKRIEKNPDGTCTKLVGTVGRFVCCKIYSERPFICMAFRPDSEACHNARKRAGLEK